MTSTAIYAFELIDNDKVIRIERYDKMTEVSVRYVGYCRNDSNYDESGHMAIDLTPDQVSFVIDAMEFSR